MAEEWLTRREVAARLDVHPNTVLLMVERGNLTRYEVPPASGSRPWIRYSASEVERIRQTRQPVAVG